MTSPRTAAGRERATPAGAHAAGLELAGRLLAGDRRALARAMSVVEDQAPGYETLLRAVFPHTGRAHRVGITGPPGAGKSTLVERLALEARAAGRSVGIVAVDPSSPFTGGALLGDRIRMAGAAGDAGVFIRSMASRGTLGGLAAASAELADLLDAQGRDLVFLETVGVGQSELEVAQAADTTVLVLTPESGDAIQAMKAGLLEAGEVLVVNKADRGGADRLRRALEAAMGWREAPRDGWRPPVLAASAERGEGVAQLGAAIDAHRAHLVATGGWEARRGERWRARVRSVVERRVARRLWEGPAAALLEEEEGEGGGSSPYDAADRLLERAGWHEASVARAGDTFNRG